MWGRQRFVGEAAVHGGGSSSWGMWRLVEEVAVRGGGSDSWGT